MRRLPFVIVAAAVAAIVSAPPASAGTVSVNLTAAGTDLSAAAARRCAVTVAEGADGATVLDAAVASGCIASWEAETFPGFGRYVTCIDGVCEARDPAGATCSGWFMFENATMTDYGIDGFEADAGDELTFVHVTSWSPALGGC